MNSSSESSPVGSRVDSVGPRSRPEFADLRRMVRAAAVLGLIAGAACSNPMALEHTTSSGNHTTGSGNLDQGRVEVSQTLPNVNGSLQDSP